MIRLMDEQPQCRVREGFYGLPPEITSAIANEAARFHRSEETKRQAARAKAGSSQVGQTHEPPANVRSESCSDGDAPPWIRGVAPELPPVTHKGDCLEQAQLQSSILESSLEHGLVAPSTSDPVQESAVSSAPSTSTDFVRTLAASKARLVPGQTPLRRPRCPQCQKEMLLAKAGIYCSTFCNFFAEKRRDEER